MIRFYTRSIQWVLGILFLFQVSNLQAQVYFSENFNGNSIPQGWTVVDQGVGICQWMIHAPYENNGIPITMLGSNFLFVNSDSAGFGTIADETITSPAITANAGGSAVFLEFSHYFRNLFGDSDTGFVQVFNGTNWVDVKTITTEIGTGESPVLEKINITQYLNPDLRIRLKYVGEYAWYWAIDNIRVFTPAANDVGVIAILNGNSNCGQLTNPYNVSVRLVNFSGANLSNIPVNYSVNGATAVSGVFGGPLAAGDSVNFTFSTPFVPSGNINYAIVAYTSQPGDVISQNDSASRIFAAIPQGLAAVNFSGYTGSNVNQILPGWTEGTGLNPEGTNSSSWINSNPDQEDLLASSAARVNLYSDFKKEWLITRTFIPKPNSSLKFDMAITTFSGIGESEFGSDDSLIVKVSTNCGQTWVNVKSFTAADQFSNALETQFVSLAAFANQNISIAFYGTDGETNDEPDYDVHITNVELFVPSGNDLALSRILDYSPNCLALSPFTVKVRVQNNGTLVQNSLPLAYSINGQPAVIQTFSQSLAPGQAIDLTFTTPAPLTQTNSLLKAWVALPLDSNQLNDTVKNFQVQKAGNTLGLVDFSNYTGGNIETLYPGWREQSGQVPNGNFSNWTNGIQAQSDHFQTTTAKSNLYSNFSKNWLISPAFVPAGGSVVRFKLAITDFAAIDSSNFGSDDSLCIKYSSTCGESWNLLKAFTADDALSNQLVEKQVPLTGLGGQKIQIAFFSTDGETDDEEDIDVHIDDVEIFLPSNNDLGVSDLVIPGGNCGLPSSLSVIAQVTNFGASAQSNFPVSYQFNNQPVVTETFNGTLAAGAQQNHSFAGMLDLSLQPINTLKVWTGLTLDSNRVNDTMTLSLSIPPLSQPVVTFTNYFGNNLAAIAPGWTEFSTDPVFPSPTNSSWVNTSNFQNPALGGPAAKVAMFSNSKREWMAGPVFTCNASSGVSFRAAVVNRGGTTPDAMGADDSVNVMVSTNCGQTWQRVFSLTAANNLPNTLTFFNVPLSAFAGERIRIAFFATEGTQTNPQDYEFVLDDIQLGIFSSSKEPISFSQGLQIYPNPGQGRFTIQSQNLENFKPNQLELIDMQGRKVNARILVNENCLLNLEMEGSPAGLYKLKIQTKDGLRLATIIKN